MLTFPLGGVHPPEEKLTAGMAIEDMPIPTELELILGQHIGAPCEPVVKKRDQLVEGDMIGQVTRGLGVPIHTPVAGSVNALGVSAHPLRVSSPSITIRTGKDAEPRSYTAVDWSGLSGAELKEKIHAAGIIGVGGAGFPAHVKLSPPGNTKIDTLLLNGAECEPYITADHRLMVEFADQVVEGARII
ncbi:MAG: electron transport complex subunit RsxC, partial [Gammaproteobacteria bacterium]|nr:electron transport complex subunit RsxC [Gammaproteobacteria bacterium]